MQLITDLQEVKSHKLDNPGSYERWYFDGIDENNEYSFVIIFYKANPFSPDYSKYVRVYNEHPEIEKPVPIDYSALSVNMYLYGRVIYRSIYEYSKNKYSSTQVNGNEKINLDKSNFYFNSNENKYYFNINLATSEFDDKFKAEFTFSFRCDPKELKPSKNGDANHYWQPLSALCDVTGKLKSYKDFKRRKTDFTGLGYADHMWGSEPLFKNIKQWYWGRVVTGVYSVVYFYFVYNKNSGKDFKKFLVYNGDKLILEKDDFEIKINRSRNYWFLNYHSGVTIEADGYKFISSNDSTLDNGPSYIRLQSRNSLFIKDKKVLSNAVGFSEYINPKRLKSDFFGSFVNMRTLKL